jgi:hypothetical protein
MLRAGWFLVLIAVLGGCATLFSRDLEPVSLATESAVRIRSGRAIGSGCLLYAERSAGAYVLTAAHLLHAPDEVLCRFRIGPGETTWRAARVLRTAPRRDLALLWLPRAIRGGVFRADWSGRAPSREDRVVLLAASESGSPERIRARVTAPGRLLAERPLAPGMSGAGVFRDGRLAGLLFGQPLNGGEAVEREGRFTDLDGIRGFLEVGFGFVIAGVPPDEPR